MDNSISKAPSTGLGHCTVCGAWTKLEMWDDRLNGRFCVECFDYVVDAEELLASKGLVRPGPEHGRREETTPGMCSICSANSAAAACRSRNNTGGSAPDTTFEPEPCPDRSKYLQLRCWYSTPYIPI